MARTSKKSDLKLAVFCGGTGTRIWPMSRKNRPKQFQNLVDDEKSMTQLMLDRLLTGFEPESIYVVTGREYAPTIIKQIPELKTENVIVEPEMRDTLACVGYAAAAISHRFPESCIATLWGADHMLVNTEELVKALKAAHKVASEDKHIVKVDTRPTYPNVNLGYIEIGEQVDRVDGFKVYEVIRQVEKPDLKTAEKFTKSWKYLWHVGYAVSKVNFLLSLYEKHAPKTYKALKKIKEGLGTDQEQEILEKEYKKIPKTSIDFAIYEHLEPGVQLDVPADLGWSDVGAWNILKDELAKSKDENVIKGGNIEIDTKDCLLYELNSDKILASVGLEGLIVVDTENVLLITRKDRSQDVKKIVKQLKKEGKKEYL